MYTIFSKYVISEFFFVEKTTTFRNPNFGFDVHIYNYNEIAMNFLSTHVHTLNVSPRL